MRLIRLPRAATCALSVVKANFASCLFPFQVCNLQQAVLENGPCLLVACPFIAPDTKRGANRQRYSSTPPRASPPACH